MKLRTTPVHNANRNTTTGYRMDLSGEEPDNLETALGQLRHAEQVLNTHSQVHVFFTAIGG